MSDLASALREVAEASGFSGVVRVDRVGEEPVVQVHGLADRAHGVGFTDDTRVGVASGAKGFTALTVMRLVEDGVLTLDTRARALLGDDLPLIDDAVTIEHLLAHRSGIGDYLDESEDLDLDAHLMPVPVHQLDTRRVLPRRARRVPAGLRARHRLRLLQRRVRRAGAACRAGRGDARSTTWSGATSSTAPA